MPRLKKSARIQKWRGKPYLFYTDYKTGKSKRVSCESLGATNKMQRDELVRQYRSMEIQQNAESILLGGPASGKSLLLDDIQAYLTHSLERSEVRKSNPKSREGLAEKSLLLIEEKMRHFQEWLTAHGHGRILTSKLEVPILNMYFAFVIGEKIPCGKKRVKKRSSSTINIYKRNVKACLRWINGLRPRRFPDFDPLLSALKLSRGKVKPPVAFTPKDMNEFLRVAIMREDPNRIVEVTPGKKGRKNVIYAQRVSTQVATPPSRLFLICALTGCRAGEALKMKWADVDLDRGRIAIESEKTGMIRWVLLADDASGSIAPTFAKLLKKWRIEDPQRHFVLPHTGIESPSFPKGVWYAIDGRADAAHITPQRLRQSFTSYAASLGIPASVAAMWQGHSADVAEKHYRAQVLERNVDATNFEDAMGLTEPILELLERYEDDPS